MTGINIGGSATLPAGIVPYMLEDTSAFWSQIWKVSRDPGQDPTQVTTQTTTFDTDPDASPNGRKIAFLRTLSGNHRLFVINADGTGELELDTGDCSAPMWHPSGSKILYRIADGFWTIEPDGTNKTDVTPSGTGGDDKFMPTWNRNGTLIAFQDAYSSGIIHDELWVCNADGSSAAFLAETTLGGLSGLNISWMHGSDVIAFVQEVGGDNVLARIDSTGANDDILTPGFDNVALSRYAWAADDSVAIFPQADASPWTIYSAPEDGSGESALSPTLNASANTREGIPRVFGSRLYVIRSGTFDLVSTALDGSDLRVEDDPSSSNPDQFPVLQGSGTEI